MTVAELTRKMHGPEVLAERDGPCRYCSRPIEAGEDYICKVDGVKGVFHATCAPRYCDDINGDLDAEFDLGDLGRLERPFPVKHCDRQTCRCLLADADDAFLYTDLEEDRLVALCDDCVRHVDLNERQRFKVVPL